MTMKPGFSYRFYHIFWSGLDLLFPPTCGGCEKLGVRWCKDCQKSLAPVPLPVCEICGEPQTIPGVCQACQNTRPAFYALRSCVVFKDSARLAMLKLKYRRELGLGEALAGNLASFLDHLGWQADVVIPIPLSKQRFAERGYNQVDMIAHPLASLMGWSYSTNVLYRTRHTGSQVKLSVRERAKNVVGAFRAVSGKLDGKTVLLVDDTTTTGATINSASISLLDAGVKRVYALTFAKAVRSPLHNA